jgi:hypothetical protein
VLLIAVALLLWLAWDWWHTTPPLAQPIEVSVLDAEAGVPAANLRTLKAAETGWGGNVRMPLTPATLVRQLAWRDREGQLAGGDWSLDLSGDQPLFSGSGGGSYAALVCDSPVVPAGQLPVQLSARRIDAQRILLEIDSEALPEGSPCYLFCPLGWFSLPTGNGRRSLELELPLAPSVPGKARLLAWQAVFDNWYERFGRQNTLVGVENAALLRQVNDSYRQGQLTTAQFYALLGALQQATGHRGTLANQVVLFCLVPNAPGASPAKATVLRLTLGLEGLNG